MAALVALAAPGLAHRVEQEGGQLVTGPTVVTWLGRVRGALGETKKGTKYFQFNRVPFAEPPVGTLRLRDPVPKLPWGPEVLDGTKDTPKCIQSDGFGQEPGGQEDCLFLTIYTPGLPSPSLALMGLRPVMLWIHGGAFVIGDGSGDPEFLLDDGVVFVSLQYRLGALGFLAVEGSSVLPGNLGLKDQQEAMRWVQRNIAAFGGDPRKVTLFGESAGAISVHAHVLSPRAHGLFRAGILHSGTALLTYERIIQKKTEKTGQDIVDKLGCGGTVDVLGCLQLLDQEAFLGVEAEVWIVQDSWAQRPVLPHNPLEQLVTGAFHRCREVPAYY
jgi:carboxylesterase type B